MPPIIFKIGLAFANFVKIFAETIGSADKATAVGPVKNFSNSLHFVSLIANFCYSILSNFE